MKEAGTEAFNYIPSDAILHVHALLVETYATDAVWGSSFAEIVPLSETFEIDGATYYIDVKSGDAIELRTPAIIAGNVTLPSTITVNGTEYAVTSIGEGAFGGCVGLVSVTIPANITHISDYAFSGCTGLKDIYCYGDAVKDAFYNTFAIFDISENHGNTTANRSTVDATLHVPASLVEAYRQTSPWDEFKRIVPLTGTDGIGHIGIDATSGYRVYSINGKALPTLQKGINIIRMKNGRSVKVMK